MKKIILLTIAILTFTSCSMVIKKMVGFKRVKPSDKDRIEKFAGKYGIPSQSLFQLDESKYYNNIKHLKKENPDLLQYFLQPMQVRVYSDRNELSQFLFSCNIGGFPNLDWNNNGMFDVYPPKTLYVWDTILADTTLYVEKEIEYFLTLDNKPVNREIIENDLNILVYWSIVGGRQSENLITEMEAYKRKFQDKKMNVIYINIDNLYIEIDKEKEK